MGVSGQAPQLMMTVPSPMGMIIMVVREKALMATGLPRVPRTMYLHIGLFSQMNDMSLDRDRAEHSRADTCSESRVHDVQCCGGKSLESHAATSRRRCRLVLPSERPL